MILFSKLNIFSEVEKTGHLRISLGFGISEQSFFLTLSDRL